MLNGLSRNMRRFALAIVYSSAVMVPVAYGAGMFSTLPEVGSPSFCASTVTGTGGLGGITGQGQGTTGSICAQTVPAGPTIVTGNEIVPADTNLPGGQAPQTVVLSMASLNALPILVSGAVTNGTVNLSASNIQGGIIVNSSGLLSTLNVSLPPGPIDGQQFAIGSNFSITTLSVKGTPATTTVSNTPTALTTSTTGAYNYRFMFNAATTTWFRLQ